ncbi:MAG: hypothetical protein HQK87_05075 [Nitrospinae bacterium]|nr:hypothetical protein [Nitrospinota bacterium]
MANGRLDALSLDQTIYNNSTLDQSKSDIQDSQSRLKGVAVQGVKNIAAQGVHLFSDTRFAADQGVTETTSKNITSFVNAVINGTGASVDISG